MENEISTFDDELDKFADGKIAGNHIFNLGKPGEILQKCGFPKDHRIELSGSRLMMKSRQRNHPFDIKDVKGLDKAIQNPVAVFEYGNKAKSQNVIVEFQRDGKNFLVGVFFNQKQRGFEVSSIRGLFNKDNIEWLRWIEQGKMIYGDKEKIQVLAAQQRTNLAEVNRKEARTSSDSYYLDSVDSIMQEFGGVKDVYKEKIQVLAAQQRINLAEVNRKEARTSSDSYYLDSVGSIMQEFGDVKDVYKEKIQVLAAQQRINLADVNRKEARTSSDSYYLDSVDSIMQKFGDVKDVYTENFEFYKENKERYKIFKAFRDIYQELESIETADAPMLAKEFYEALKNDDTRTLLKYTDGEMYPEIAEKAGELVRSFNLEHNRIQKLTDKTLFSEERNEVVGVGVAPTIYHLRFTEGDPATRLRPSPTTENSIIQESKSVNENIATNFVLEKLKGAGIEVVTDKDEFNRILKEETLLQKMVEGGESHEKIEHQRQLVNGLVVNQEPPGLSEDNIANAFKQLDRSLRFNANFEIQSEKLGEEVSVFPGSTGKNGLGIRHIIEERTKKDGLSLDEVTALSSLIVDAVQTGDITRDSENRCEISKNGIIAIVRKDFDDRHKNWILTGFHYEGEDVEKSREATETIQTVIAKYGQSPDYSYFRSQVGAVISSLDLNISQTPIKSSGVSKIADQNNVTEVKDNTISVTSLKTETVNKRASIRSPNDTYELLSHIKNEGQEHFGVILLDEAYNVKAINTLTIGTKNKSVVHPREVFSEAIKTDAASMIVFHNHPSGNPQPSDEDLNTTRALLRISEIMGIPIIDHVIAAKNSYYSFLEQDILDNLKPKTEFLIKNNQVYGFTHNGKIYLDPEIMNSNAAIHEYTHLWDKYTQNTNPELWERGKEIFSKTHIWDEVKADPNYADISSDDDLILSEVHSRICGEIAEQVLERIASEDGEITRDKAIDWDREVWDYLSNEFLTAEDKEILFDERQKDQINEFISLSLKDLMEEKEILLSQSMEQSRISGIEKTISETISQKKSREENMENENSTTVPDLRTHNRLKEDDIRNLEVITDEDFSDIIDSMLLNDYRHIPNVIRLPNIRGDLAEKLGLEKDAAFIMKNGISHIRPARKGAYEQAFDDEEYRSIPKIIREATFAVIDKRYNNFQFVFDDEENEKMINKIVFNKDRLGNYLVTVGKVNRRDSFSETINEVVGVGVAPTISALRGEPPATRLRPSPTTENSIAQEYKPVNEKENRVNKTIEKELENKGARENRRAVADLDLEYQSKASRIADLDLEYPYKNRFSRNEFSGAWIPSNNAKTIKELMENNESLTPFLPNERGEINARPIYNANTGECLALKDLIPMQIKMDTVMSLENDGIKIGDFYTPIAATKKSIDAARTSIKPGERGVFYNFKRKDGTIGTSQYFFPEQTESPDKVIQSAQKKISESHRKIGGENNVASRTSITITSSEPKEYLGRYYAAMITNSALKCSPEIGREFKEKFNAVLENQLADKKDFNPKIGTLHNLFFEASKVSSDIIKQMDRGSAHSQAQQKELKRNGKTEMSR